MRTYIELKNVSYAYKKTGFSIKDVSFALGRGETTVLSGGNGSGKTTLSKLMMGILKPDSGHVLIEGGDTKKMALHETAKRIGYLFQNPERQLFCSTVLEEITFSLRHAGADAASAQQKAAALLAQFSMGAHADDFPLKLSRGEKQRLALLAVFAMDPPYYILDEPSSGIDSENKQKLIGMLEDIRSNGAGLLLITHDKELKERLADRVITVAEGRVAHENA